MLIVKVGEAVEPVRRATGEDFEHWFRAGLGLDEQQAPVVSAHLDEPLPPVHDFGAVIVTGSPAMVTDRAPWSVRTGSWLREVVHGDRYVLGVCYGHQLLCDALGGAVGDNPNGREIGTITAEQTADGREDPLLGGLDRPLVMQATHSQSVVTPPPGARVLARNHHDGHQAFAWGSRVWGVQFHPEFTGPIIRGYIAARAAALRTEGLDPEALVERVRDTDHGHRFLRRFLAFAQAGAG